MALDKTWNDLLSLYDYLDVMERIGYEMGGIGMPD